MMVGGEVKHNYYNGEIYSELEVLVGERETLEV